MAYRNEQIPIGHMGDAWNVAHAALFLASDDASTLPEPNSSLMAAWWRSAFEGGKHAGNYKETVP